MGWLVARHENSTQGAVWCDGGGGGWGGGRNALGLVAHGSVHAELADCPALLPAGFLNNKKPKKGKARAPPPVVGARPSTTYAGAGGLDCSRPVQIL